MVSIGLNVLLLVCPKDETTIEDNRIMNRFFMLIEMLCYLTARRYVLVSVTRRKHRIRSCYPPWRDNEMVTVPGGFGMRFCCHVEICLAYTSVAVQGGWFVSY